MGAQLLVGCGGVCCSRELAVVLLQMLVCLVFVCISVCVCVCLGVVCFGIGVGAVHGDPHSCSCWACVVHVGPGGELLIKVSCMSLGQHTSTSCDQLETLVVVGGQHHSYMSGCLGSGVNLGSCIKRHNTNHHTLI